MTTLFGIKNCDTVRKARRWLDEHQVPYRFHDLRQDGLETGTVQDWSDRVGWETLLNRRSATWRKLSESQREVSNPQQAVDLMMQYPTLIRRPVLVHPNGIHVGFSEPDYQDIFSAGNKRPDRISDRGARNPT